jgi:hypothetical protein
MRIGFKESKHGHRVLPWDRPCQGSHIPHNLDLLSQPSILFYESGYSTFTLRQASRRSWRIRQTRPVRVNFLTYAGTMQESCLRLMGKKLLVSHAIEGSSPTTVSKVSTRTTTCSRRWLGAGNAERRRRKGRRVVAPDSKAARERHGELPASPSRPNDFTR